MIFLVQFGIWNPTSDWNPDWNQIPRNRSPRRGIHVVESRIQDCLEFPYASGNSTCAQPPPPGNCGAFAPLVSPGGGAFANVGTARGPGICQPPGQSRAFDTHAVSYQNKTTRRIYWKKSRLAHLSRTGINCRGL